MIDFFCLASDSAQNEFHSQHQVVWKPIELVLISNPGISNNSWGQSVSFRCLGFVGQEEKKSKMRFISPCKFSYDRNGEVCLAGWISSQSTFFFSLSNSLLFLFQILVRNAVRISFRKEEVTVLLLSLTSCARVMFRSSDRNDLSFVSIKRQTALSGLKLRGRKSLNSFMLLPCKF